MIGGFPLSATCTVKVFVVFAPVGLPLIVPDWLIVSPAGRLPEAIVSVNGATPPVTETGNEYGTPFAPFGGKVVPNVGAMTTSMVTVAVALISAKDKASNETESVAETPLGAVYRTLLDVAFVSVPQPAPEQPEPVNSHITPLLEVSFASVAIKVSDWPVSTIWVVPGII